MVNTDWCAESQVLTTDVFFCQARPGNFALFKGAGRGKAHPSSAATWSFGQCLSNPDADRWRQCVHARTGGAKGHDVRPFSGAHALRQRVRREQLAHEADVDARRSRVPGQQRHVTLWQAQQPQHLRTHGLSNSKMRGGATAAKRMCYSAACVHHG